MSSHLKEGSAPAFTLSAQTASGTNINISANRPVNVKILHHSNASLLSQNPSHSSIIANELQYNNINNSSNDNRGRIVELPASDLVASQLPHVIDSYRRNDFIGVFAPMVTNYLSNKLRAALDPNFDEEDCVSQQQRGNQQQHQQQQQQQQQMGTLGKIIAINYDSVNGDKLRSIRLQTFGPITLDRLDGEYAQVIPGSFQNQKPPTYSEHSHDPQVVPIHDPAQIQLLQQQEQQQKLIQQQQLLLQQQQAKMAAIQAQGQYPNSNALVPYQEQQMQQQDDMFDSEGEEDSDGDESYYSDDDVAKSYLFSSKALESGKAFEMLEYQAEQSTKKAPQDVLSRNLLLHGKALQAEEEEKQKQIQEQKLQQQEYYQQQQSGGVPRRKRLTAREIKKQEEKRLVRQFKDLDLSSFKDELYRDMGKVALTSTTHDPKQKQKLLENEISSEKQKKTLEFGPTRKYLQYNNSSAQSTPKAKQSNLPQLPYKTPSAIAGPTPALMLSPPPPPPPMMMIPRAPYGLQLQGSNSSYTPRHNKTLMQRLPQYSSSLSRKNSVAVPNLLSLIIPISEPVFPTTTITNLRIINPVQKQAIIQMANNDQLVGLFYIKDPLFKSYDIVTAVSDIHEYGVLGKISSYTSFTDEETGLKPLIVSLTTLSSIKLEKLIPPQRSLSESLSRENKYFSNTFETTPSPGKKEGVQGDGNSISKGKEDMLDLGDLEGTNLQQLVCLGNVSVHNSKYSKDSLSDIKHLLAKILKKLSKLYHKNAKSDANPNLETSILVPGFQERYLEILERNIKNMEGLHQDQQRRGSRKTRVYSEFNFYNIDNDNIEMVNVKLNVVAEILKNYFSLKYAPQTGSSSTSSPPSSVNLENKINLQYYLGIFQNILEKSRLNAKAQDIYNLLEMVIFNYRNPLPTIGSGGTSNHSQTKTGSYKQSGSLKHSQKEYNDGDQTQHHQFVVETATESSSVPASPESDSDSYYGRLSSQVASQIEAPIIDTPTTVKSSIGDIEEEVVYSRSSKSSPATTMQYNSYINTQNHGEVDNTSHNNSGSTSQSSRSRLATKASGRASDDVSRKLNNGHFHQKQQQQRHDDDHHHHLHHTANHGGQFYPQLNYNGGSKTPKLSPDSTSGTNETLLSSFSLQDDDDNDIENRNSNDNDNEKDNTYPITDLDNLEDAENHATFTDNGNDDDGQSVGPGFAAVSTNAQIPMSPPLLQQDQEKRKRASHLESQRGLSPVSTSKRTDSSTTPNFCNSIMRSGGSQNNPKFYVSGQAGQHRQE